MNYWFKMRIWKMGLLVFPQMKVVVAGKKNNIFEKSVSY